jgi:hypothetical protein
MNQHAAGPTQWTYDEYARLPDDGDRYEVIQGEVCVTPGPRPRPDPRVPPLVADVPPLFAGW